MFKLEQMNEAQREAVMHGEGPLLVLAGPGSGKTFTITQRILYLIEVMQVPPEEILVITFTKDAAQSMQQRFLEQSESSYPVNFGTFHSVFFQILKKSNPAGSKSILRESQKKNLLLPILKNFHDKFKKSSSEKTIPDKPITDMQALYEDADNILSAISYYKNTLDLERAVEKVADIWKEHFQYLFNEYDELRRQRGAIDFDDMVYECERLLRTDEVARKYWSKRFSHILMDEFQDINLMQYRVINLLAKEPYNLFAVGDDDQAIYGFRGSKPACMKQFAEEYHAKQVLLNINYRSRSEIIKASSLVIKENKERFSKNMVSCEGQKSEGVESKRLESEGVESKGRESKRQKCERQKCEREEGKEPASQVVKLCSFKEREEQYQYLIQMLEEWGNGDSHAILFRTNASMQGFAARLKKRGISFEMKESSASIYEHFIVKDIMAYMRIAAGEEKESLYLKILNRPVRFISREALSRLQGLEYGGKANEFRGIAAMKDYYSKYAVKNQMQDSEWSNNPIFVPDIQIERAYEEIYSLEKHLKYLKQTLPYLSVVYICKVIGYEKYLKDACRKQCSGMEKWQEWEELLEWLKEDAKQYDSFNSWRQAQEEYNKALEEGKREKNTILRKEQNIHLMTVHASKGLEFDYVWIPDCNEKIFPHGNMPDAETCEEERRIFYVAMTRAKKGLRLLYLTGTKERPKLPSRFINPIKNL